MNVSTLSPLAQELLSHWKGQIAELTPFGKEALTCEAVCKITKLGEECIGKAMLVVADEKVGIIMIPGNQRLKIKMVKESLLASKVSLIPPKEIAEKTGLIVGAVTPLICFLRKDIFLAVDNSLLAQPIINISTGDPTVGMNICPNDLQRAFVVQSGIFI